MRKWALALPLAGLCLLAGATTALAATPNVGAAFVGGPWHLLVTVDSYTGPPEDLQPGAVQPRPVGHQAIDTLWFQSACQAPGDCAVRVFGPAGPNAPGAVPQFYSNTSGFEGPSSDLPLRQTGAILATTVIPSGFGGFVCSPPPPPRPVQQLTLRVTNAKQQRDGGWLATTLQGTETLIAGWGCNGKQATGWRTVTLSILGHPVGYALPAPRSDVLTVSSIASALNLPGDAFRSPLLIVANLVITAIVILFITFPAALFNHTLNDNYEEISAATRRLRPALTGVGAAAARIGAAVSGRRDALVFGLVLLAGALLNGLLDPAFGFNPTSATSYLATLVTICFGVAVSAAVALAYRRLRGQDPSWRPHALPLGLLIAATCVLISRLTGFAPGYFYGFVCGVAFTTALPRRESGHTAALAAITTMLLAVLAWFAWAAVQVNAQANGGWPVVLLTDFLGSVFVGGLVGNVVGLLPLRSLAGGTLIAWHRGVWGVIFGVALFGMVQVLLHPEQGAVHPSGAPLLTAVLLFVGFGGGSLAFNRYFAWAGRPTRPHPAAPSPPAPSAPAAAPGG